MTPTPLEEDRIDETLIPPAPPLTDDELDSELEQIVVTAPRGYGDKLDHTFIADTHASLQRDLAGGTISEATHEELTKGLNRSTLRLALAMDAADALKEQARLVHDDAANEAVAGNISNAAALEMLSSKLAVAAATSVMSPERAAIAALINRDVPPTTEEATRNALILGDEMLLAISKRLEDRKIIDLSFENYAWDLLVHFPNPFRQMWGVGKFGNKAEDSWLNGFAQALQNWRAMSTDQRRAFLPQLEQMAWEGAGENALVYGSIIYPFYDEGDELWTYLSILADVPDSVLTLGALFKLGKYLLSAKRLKSSNKLLKRSLKANERALARGNVEEAAEITVQGIKAKNTDAVAEASPIALHKVDESLSPGQSPAISTALEDMSIAQRAVERGVIDEGESLTVTVPPLTVKEVSGEGLEPLRRQLIADGTVIHNERVIFEDDVPVRVEFDVITPPTERLLTRDVKQAVKATKENIKRLKRDLKLVVKGTSTGEQTATKQGLLTQLEAQNKELAELQASLDAARKGRKRLPRRTLLAGTEEARTVSYDFTVDDATGFAKFEPSQEVSAYGAWIGTPEARLGPLYSDLTSLVTLVRQQQRLVFGLFDKPLRKIRGRLGTIRSLAKLNRHQKQNVTALLTFGDKIRKRFTDAELTSGLRVDELGFHQFTPNEIKIYNEIRDLYDDLWRLADRMQVDELNFAGYRQFKVNRVDPKDPTKTKVVRIYAKTGSKDVKHLMPKVGNNPITRAVDTRTGQPVELSSIPDLHQGMREKRYGFVELKDDFVDAAGEYYSWALVEVRRTGKYKEVLKATKVEPRMLDYREGYVPKLVGERISHVAIIPRTVVRNGVEVTGESNVLRAFGSSREADIWAAKYAAAHPDAKLLPRIESLASVKRDPKYARLAKDIDERLYRGAFVGHRHENSKFLVGMEAREAKRIDPYEAMQRYADFVARNYPMHEWKQAMIKRFLDSAKKRDARGNVVKGDSSWLEIPTRWDSQLDKSATNYRELKALQDQLRVAFSVPTTDETEFFKIQRGIFTTLDRLIWDVPNGAHRFGPFVTEGLTKTRDYLAVSQAFANPLGVFKTTTFNLMLSFLNVRQKLVQMSGMLLPIMMHPLEATQSMPDFLYLRTAQAMATDVNAWSKNSKYVGLNPEKMKTLHRAWIKSGIADSILENADYGLYQGTHGAYYSVPLAHEASKKLRFFYDSGELDYRAMAFTLAFNRKASQHGWDLTKPLNDAQLREVVQETLRLGMNMGPANAARWQNSGATGLLTQFWQQTHKFYENMVFGLATDNARATGRLVKENQWTQQETFNVLFGSLLMAGAAGFGIDELVKEFDANLFSKEGLNLDPVKDREIVSFLRGGITELLAFNLMGYEVDLADSISPGSGISMVIDTGRLWVKAFTDLSNLETREVMQMLVGASASTATRIGKAVAKTAEVLAVSSKGKDGFTTDQIQVIIGELVKLPSSGTNYEKARLWMKFNDITDADGKPMYIIENGEQVPVAALFARLAGFDPLALEYKWLARERENDRKRELENITKGVVAHMRNYLTPSGELTDEARRNVSKVTVDFLLDGLSGADKARVMASAYETLNKEYVDGFSNMLFDAFLRQDLGSEKEKITRDTMNINRAATIKPNKDETK